MIIIIHPGSLNLRIGRASDLNPHRILNAIARRRRPGGKIHRDTMLPPAVQKVTNSRAAVIFLYSKKKKQNKSNHPAKQRTRPGAGRMSSANIAHAAVVLAIGRTAAIRNASATNCRIQSARNARNPGPNHSTICASERHERHHWRRCSAFGPERRV